MSDIKGGAQAFPIAGHSTFSGQVPGMTMRQYAAIKLRIPESGADWIDDMIRKSMRDYFAAQCMSAWVGKIRNGRDAIQFSQMADSIGYKSVFDWFASESYKQADAMLRAREVKS